MSLYKQNGSKNWWVSLYRGQGVPRFRRSTGTDDRAKARSVEATFRLALQGNVAREQLIASIDALMGFDGLETGIPVGSISGAYLALPEHREKQSTVQTRSTHVREMEAWMLENWPTARFMHQISREAAVAYGDDLRRECKTGKTYNNRRGNLVRVFNLLLIRGGCRENVWTLVATAGTDDSKHGRAFTPKEETRLLDACRAAGHQWFEMSMVAKYTGLRYGDIANLKMSDIQDGCIILKPSKTARKKIKVVVPMHPAVQKVIAGLKRKSGSLFPDHAFADYEHRPLKGGYTSIIEKAEIPPDGAVLSFHCWRHTFRTRLAQADVPTELAMKLGGWTERDTADIYNHDTTQLRTAIEALD